MNADLGLLFYVAAIGLLLIGVWGIVTSRHLVRIVLAITLLEAGANLLLVAFGYRADAAAPIIVQGIVANGAPMVDPVPQALVLTSIVIGVGGLALALSLMLRVQRAYGTLDLRVLRKRLEQDIADQADVELPTSINAPDLPPVGRVEPLPKGSES